MSRSIRILTARQVATVEAPGRYADGGGLFLSVEAKGSRSWIFVTSEMERRAEIGLGDTSCLSLTTARRLAVEMRYAIAARQDPRSVIAPASRDVPDRNPTFGAFAAAYISSVESEWKNSKYQEDWRHALLNHAEPLLGKSIDQIDTDDIVGVLEPIWLRFPETANKLRGRIKTILDAAEERGLRPKEAINPATWYGHLIHLLPDRPKLVRGHHSSLSWAEAPCFIADLRTRQAMAARCLEFVALTVARSAECLDVTWAEIDWKSKMWAIPATRTSAGIEHVVPLSTAAVTLLENLRPEPSRHDMLVFSIEGKPLSKRAMAMLLRRMKRDNVTPHGFRSTFSNWARDATDFSEELVKHALARTVLNTGEPGPSRVDSIAMRRELMEAWSQFLVRDVIEPGGRPHPSAPSDF